MTLQTAGGSFKKLMIPVREPNTYSILLAGGLTPVREGLAARGQAQPQCRVVAQCADGTTALRLIKADRPDLAVRDLNLPDLFTREIFRKLPEAQVLTRMVVRPTRKHRKTEVEVLRASGVPQQSGPSLFLRWTDCSHRPDPSQKP
jgi:CheY-like chemotaxis protein